MYHIIYIRYNLCLLVNFEGNLFNCLLEYSIFIGILSVTRNHETFILIFGERTKLILLTMYIIIIPIIVFKLNDL